MAALDGVRIKLARAHTHIRELDETLRPLLEVDRYNFVRDPDGHPTKPVFHIVKVPEIDPAWSSIVGDVVFDLRSAYDHLAWQLVILNGGQPTDDTQFPVRHSRTNKKGEIQLLRIEPGIRRRDILDAVDAVQPYQTDPFTNDYLWAVNKLCNIDKHRLLLVMVCALDIDQTWFGLPAGIPTPEIRLSFKPLKDGDPVAWFDFRGTEAPPDFDPHLALTVKLDEGPPGNIIRRFPVVDFLGSCGESLCSGFNTRGNFIDLFKEEWFAFGHPGTKLPANDVIRGIPGHRFPPANQ